MSQQTGPRTAEGKARSAMNAFKHGFTAEHLVVPEDQREEFDELRAGLVEELDPEGTLERLAFNRLIHAAWNLHRLAITENEVFAGSEDPLGDPELSAKLDRLARYQTRHERAYRRALKELEHLQTERTIRTSIPEEIYIAPLAATQQVHSAKRNRKTCWPHPVDLQMEALDREIQVLEAGYESRKAAREVEA